MPAGHPVLSAPQTHGQEEGDTDVPEQFHRSAADVPVCAGAQTSQNPSVLTGAVCLSLCVRLRPSEEEPWTCTSFRLQASTPELRQLLISPS